MKKIKNKWLIVLVSIVFFSILGANVSLAAENVLSYYGTGFYGRTIRPFAPSSKDRAIGPIIIPRDGEIKSIALYLMFAVKGNYYKGTGGRVRWSIKEDNNGFDPSQPELAGFSLNDPIGSIYFPEDQYANGERGSLKHLMFETPFQVTAGQKLWLQGHNSHPNPSENWLGVNCLANAEGVEGEIPYVYKEQENGQFERYVYPDEGWFIPIYEMKYTDDSSFGIGYEQAYFSADVGGNKKARQVFTPKEDVPVDGLYLWVKRFSGNAFLTATLRQRVDGQIIKQAVSEIASGKLFFDMKTILQKNQEYELEFTAPSGSSYEFLVNLDYGGWSEGSTFSDGVANYNDGTGYKNGWLAWNAWRKADLQFYFHIDNSSQPSPTPQPTNTSQPSPTNEPPKKYNLTNFIKLANNWLKKITNNQELTKEIDLNNDGIINSRDIGIMMSNWE